MRIFRFLNISHARCERNEKGNLPQWPLPLRSLKSFGVVIKEIVKYKPKDTNVCSAVCLRLWVP